MAEKISAHTVKALIMITTSAFKWAVKVLQTAPEKVFRALNTMVRSLIKGQPDEKRCKKCDLVQPLAEFYQHKGHKNRVGVCRTCQGVKNKLSGQIFREHNPEYNIIMNKKHRKRKTELAREYRNKK